MAQTVPLTWSGSFGNFGGPLASGATHSWVGTGEWGAENRFYQFSVFSDGVSVSDLEVRNVTHHRAPGAAGGFVDETHFDIHNRNTRHTDPPVMYYFYIAWTNSIMV